MKPLRPVLPALLLGLGVACLAPAPAAASTPPSLAVAPFAGSDGAAASARLADALAGRGLERVVPPAELADDWSPDPEARDVRRWASREGVDHVVVGRGRRADDGIEIEAELRSGHSGAAISRYRERASGPDDLPAASARLASAVLKDLGVDATPEPAPGPALPAVASKAPADGGATSASATPAQPRKQGGAGRQSDDGEAPRFGVGIGKSDAPIRIRSDELEMITNDAGRQIVFTRNVVVTQADIVLETDALEAFYPGEASQPDRLVATGHVRVTRGERKALCDRATYDRATSRVICTGHAMLEERCDQVRGEEIHFDLESDRVRVLGAPSVVIHPEGSEPQDACQEGLS